MTRTKIDYGIDLGTTNSAISRMENGEPIIKKNLKNMPGGIKSECVQFGAAWLNQKAQLGLGTEMHSTECNSSSYDFIQDKLQKWPFPLKSHLIAISVKIIAIWSFFNMTEPLREISWQLFYNGPHIR